MAIIAGFVGHRSNQAEGALSRMLSALPCPSGFKQQDDKGEGSAILWRGRPKLGGFVGRHEVAPGRPLVVCLDGIVANLDDLGRELDCQGRDGVVVLATGYAQWGDGIVSRLEGTFSLAVHDPQRRTLQLFRDRIGSMPLYWGQGADSCVAFASLPAAVCVGLGQAVAAPASRIRRELMGIDVLAPGSMFDGVNAVEPGCSLLWREGVTRSVRHFNLAELRVLGASESELVHTMRQGILKGVGWYLNQPEADVGVAFSGGLDSSVVVGAASSSPHENGRLRAITSVPSGKAAVDAKYAKLVAEHCAVEWVRIDAEAVDIPDALLNYAANPVRVCDLAFSWQVFEKANQTGCNTVLTGALGDVIGGVGSDWTIAMLAEGRFSSIVDEYRANGARGLWLVRGMFGLAYRYASYRARAHRVFRGNGASTQMNTTLDLIGATGHERKELIQERLELEYRSEVSSGCLAEWVSWVIGQFATGELEAFGLLGRVLGLEVSSPLIHPDVLSSGMSVPWALRRHRGLTRVALREAASPWLPREVVQRREKVEFSDHLLPMWRRAVATARATQSLRQVAGMVDLTVWNALCDEKGNLPHSVVNTLYEVTVLERWLRLNAARSAGNQRQDGHGIL